MVSKNINPLWLRHKFIRESSKTSKNSERFFFRKSKIGIAKIGKSKQVESKLENNFSLKTFENQN